MRPVLTYVETDVAMADDHVTAAWVFDVDLWGRCGQGHDADGALRALIAAIGGPVRPIVVERIHGDEQAFQRDFQPATDAERRATSAVLAAVRRETIAHSSPVADDRTRRRDYGGGGTAPIEFLTLASCG